MTSLDDYKDIYEYIFKEKSDHKDQDSDSFLIHFLIRYGKIKLPDIINYVNDHITDQYDLENYWRYISRHKYLTWDIIEQYPDKPWNWDRISQNTNIKWSDIKNNLNNHFHKWNWEYLSNRIDLDLEYVIDDMDNPWDWHQISSNKILTWDLVNKNLDKPWNWYYISQHPNIKWSNIKNNLDNPNCKWEWGGISKNPNINCEIINSNLNKPWIWYNISSNKNLTWKFISKHKNKPFSWHDISSNYCVDYQTIIDNPNLEWIYANFQLNPNFNFNLVKKFPLEYDWDWFDISRHPNISWECIISNLNDPNFEWYWEYVSLNLNISFKIVSENLDKPWDWQNLSQNPNIEVSDMINTFYDKNYKWEPEYISQNPTVTWKIIKQNIISDKKIEWNWVELIVNKYCDDPHFRSAHYKKKLVRQFLDKCWLELINKSCRPNRLFNWNEYACDEFPEDYRLECKKVRNQS
jgi:hypothetical protein